MLVVVCDRDVQPVHRTNGDLLKGDASSMERVVLI